MEKIKRMGVDKELENLFELKELIKDVRKELRRNSFAVRSKRGNTFFVIDMDRVEKCFDKILDEMR